MTSHASGSPTAPSGPMYARQPRNALIAAAVVAGVLVLQHLVGSLSWLPTSLGQGSAAPSIVGFVFEFVGLIAFAAGVYVLLWLVPTSSADRLPIVLAKGLLATAGGVVASMIVGALGALLLFPPRGFLGFVSDLPGILASVLDRAPLVMLVVVVQWVILRDRRA